MLCVNHQMPGKETEWAAPPLPRRQHHVEPRLDAHPRTLGGCQGHVLIFSSDTSWQGMCSSGSGGQISTDKAGTLSDLEARICCFSAQSNPSKAQLDSAPNTWRTEEPPTAGGTVVPPKHSLSLPHDVPCSNSARQSQHGPTLQKRTLGMGSQRGLHGRHSR